MLQAWSRRSSSGNGKLAHGLLRATGARHPCSLLLLFRVECLGALKIRGAPQGRRGVLGGKGEVGREGPARLLRSASVSAGDRSRATRAGSLHMRG